MCGGSAGIGYACGVALANLNAEVTLVARNQAKLDVAVQSLAGAGDRPPRHGTLALDLCDLAATGAAVAKQIQQLGPYHILVNNTGGPPSGAMADATIPDLLAAFTSLLLSAHVLTQAVLPGMKQARYGRIINISSTSVKQPIPNLGLSNAIRAAVSNWGKCLATEVGGFGVTVNSVLPGFVQTQRLAEIFQARSEKLSRPVSDLHAEALAEVPAGRFAQPQEIAAVVAFLASPAAAYINGVQLPVDGGRLKGL